MKVCVLGLRGLPQVMGGVETHCEQLFSILKQQRPNDTFTIISRMGYVAKTNFEYCGLQIVALPHAKNKYFETMTNTLYGVLYARFHLHADLVHLHCIGPALMAPVAKALGMKVVVTYHSKNYEHRKWNLLARAVLRTGELCAVYFADRVIAVSQCLARDLKCRFPRAAARICCIPNGANHLQKIKSKTSSAGEILVRYGLAKNGYIISVGRLVPEKGLHDLIASFKAANLNCKLVIVGDADHRDNYSDCLRKQASTAIVFTGFVTQDVLQALLENASLFVLSSYNEGLPIAALEAVVAGAPVLLSDIEANRDLELPARNYFKVGDVDELRRKLISGHDLYHVDRDRILQQHDWNVVAQETGKLYALVQEICT